MGSEVFANPHAAVGQLTTAFLDVGAVREANATVLRRARMTNTVDNPETASCVCG
ncbi:MAG: hypothetical protein JO108_33495 [Acidobacteriaceae bacterium]|nr:hypothetical protein [Acidobacteriaceae bacterium]